MEINDAGKHSLSIMLDDSSGIGEARRAVAGLANEEGLNETERGELALIVTELGNNILRHAGNGEIITRRLWEFSESGVEVLAIDNGPGMHDISKCLTDGYSSSSTPGTGLGAISRMSGAFDIFSKPGKGAVIMSRVYSKSSPVATAAAANIKRFRSNHGSPYFQVGAVCIPKPGQTVCGDGWDVSAEDDKLYFTVIDGLGHGPIAAEASREARSSFLSEKGRSPADRMDAAHAALRSTRGAVMAVAMIDSAANSVSYTGIGNIAGVVYSEERTQHMVSMNGTVGQIARPAREFHYPFDDDSRVIMMSDGIQTQIKLSEYGVSALHPSLVAGLVYRDWCRGRDDATVLVISRAADYIPQAPASNA